MTNFKANHNASQLSVKSFQYYKEWKESLEALLTGGYTEDTTTS